MNADELYARVAQGMMPLAEFEAELAALSGQEAPASQPDEMRELPPKDTLWSVDDWSTWSYQVGLKLDRWVPAIGHDNRTRIETVIAMFKERETALKAAQPIPVNVAAQDLTCTQQPRTAVDPVAATPKS